MVFRAMRLPVVFSQGAPRGRLLYGHTYSEQPGELNRENVFPERSPLRIWSRETGSAGPASACCRV